MPAIEVIVPTYREAANLPALLARLLETFDRSGLDASVLIVDDDSQDGTEQALRPFLAAGRVHLHVRRGERGLSTAVLEGLRRSQARVIVVCDADLSHPPETIPELVAPILAGDAEMTIGSRYISGGQDVGRGFWRLAASRISCWLARPLTPVQDAVSGFFAVSREIVDREKLDPLGFKIGLEIFVRCRVEKYREIPIRFVDRITGKSKLGSREVIAYLRHLLRLAEFRRPEWVQFVRFGLVGTLGFLCDSLLFFLGYRLLGLHYLAAQAASFAGAATHNFLWHRHWTFPRGREARAMFQYISFLAVALAALGLRTVLMAWLVEKFGWSPYGAFVLGVVVLMAVNFVGSRHLVFRGVRP